MVPVSLQSYTRYCCSFVSIRLAAVIIFADRGFRAQCSFSRDHDSILDMPLNDWLVLGIKKHVSIGPTNRNIRYPNDVYCFPRAPQDAGRMFKPHLPGIQPHRSSWRTRLMGALRKSEIYRTCSLLRGAARTSHARAKYRKFPSIEGFVNTGEEDYSGRTGAQGRF